MDILFETAIYGNITEHLEENKVYSKYSNLFTAFTVFKPFKKENSNKVIASPYTSNINYDNKNHQVVGERRSELSKHLGNVLEVVTDCKLQVFDDGSC